MALMRTAAAMLLLLVWPPGSIAYECPDFAGREWDFVGHLVANTFPGPPDYESVTSGDEPVSRWYLQLPYAACFSEYAHQTLIQLTLQPEEFEKYRQLLGKQIRIKGTLEEGGAWPSHDSAGHEGLQPRATRDRRVMTDAAWRQLIATVLAITLCIISYFSFRWVWRDITYWSRSTTVEYRSATLERCVRLAVSDWPDVSADYSGPMIRPPGARRRGCYREGHAYAESCPNRCLRAQ